MRRNGSRTHIFTQFTPSKLNTSSQRDDSHKQRFHLAATCCDYQCATNSYYTALYLLTADEPLYKRCSRCFMRSGLCMENIDIQGISPLDYTLYAYARKLNTGETDFSVTELIDGWSVPPEVFRYIVNAIMVAKHGVAVLNITKTTTESDKSANKNQEGD